MQRSPKVTSTHRVSALFSAPRWKTAALCACAPPTGGRWNNTSAGRRMGKVKDGGIIKKKKKDLKRGQEEKAKGEKC